MKATSANCTACQLPLTSAQRICPYCGSTQSNTSVSGIDSDHLKRFGLALLFLAAIFVGFFYFYKQPETLVHLLSENQLLNTISVILLAISAIIILTSWQQPWRAGFSVAFTSVGLAMALVVAASYFEPHGLLYFDIELPLVPMAAASLFLGLLLWPLPRGTFWLKALLLWGFAALMIAKPFLKPMEWEMYSALEGSDRWKPMPVDSETHFYFLIPGILLGFFTTILALAALKKFLTPEKNLFQIPK